MDPSFKTNTLGSLQLFKTSENKESFNYSKKNNIFIISQHCLLNKDSDIISFSKINSSVELKNITNNISFNVIKQKNPYK